MALTPKKVLLVTHTRTTPKGVARRDRGQMD